MDDAITLLTTTITTDEYGNQIETVTGRQVLCQVQTVGRTEFYQAAQADMHPEYVFKLSHFRDYLGEKLLEYTDWTGATRQYVITRTYKDPNGDALELTAEERIINYEN